MKRAFLSAPTQSTIGSIMRLFTLSSLVAFLSLQQLNAQTVNTPLVINSGNSPALYSGADIDIDAVGTEAIKVNSGQLSITNSDITLKSDKTGLLIQSNSDVTIIGSTDKNTITSTATSGDAVSLSGNGILHLENLNIIATGNTSSSIGAAGVSVYGQYGLINAQAKFDKLNINTLHVRGLSLGNSLFDAHDFRIVTGFDEATGDYSTKTHLTGVNAESTNFINLSNGYIETWTDYSLGINAAMDTTDTSIERLSVNNIHIVTHGNNATGIDNINTRSSINGGSITTYGIGGHGIGASNGGVPSWAPSHVTVTGTQINTHGQQGYGLVATTSSNIEASGVHISTSGTSGVGVYSQSTGRVNVSGNSTISTTGDGAHAAAIMLGSEINLTNTQIKTTGDNAAGVYMAGYNYTNRTPPPPPPVRTGDPDDFPRSSTDETLTQEEMDRAGESHTNKVTLTGVTLDVANGAAFSVKGGLDNTIHVSNSRIRSISGAQSFLLKSDLYNTHDVGFISLQSDNSTMAGDFLANSGEVDFTLTNRSQWLGAALIGDNDNVLNTLTLDTYSAWLITENSTVNNLVNEGIIGFAPTNTNFKTLTVLSDFNSGGGLFILNSQLGDDNSDTDLIVFKQDVIGDIQLAIRNAGGLGAQTFEGIKIVEIDGGSTGSVRLASPYRHQGRDTVVAGAYTYKLYQGGIINPNDGNWYLRSNLNNNGYQAGVPVYEVYPQFLLGLNTLPTLQQRVGNRYWRHSPQQTFTQEAKTMSLASLEENTRTVIQNDATWGRIEGAHHEIKPHTSTSHATYDYNAYTFQVGQDGLVHENADGRLIAGVNLRHIHGTASVWSPNDADLGRGRIRTDGYGLGGTLTWYGNDGLYSDNQAQLTWYRSALSYQGGRAPLKNGKNEGFGYALSSELGQRFALNQQWSLIPQAQLHYSNVDFDRFTDVFGAEISREKADSLQGRLGISADYQNTWRDDNGCLNRSSVYGIANIYNEFLNGTRVDVSTVPFSNKNERLWTGTGIGGSYNWNNDKYSIYGEGSINTSIRNFSDSYGYKGTVGFRVKW